MPAHLSDSSVGHAVCSNGQVVAEDMWLSNQLVDVMAKSAGESVQLPASFRSSFRERERQLEELFVFLGQLTVAANAHDCGDGSVLRDSDACRARRKRPLRRVTPRRSLAPGGQGNGARLATVGPPLQSVSDVVAAWTNSSCAKPTSSAVQRSATAVRCAAAKRARAAVTSEQQTVFLKR